MVTDSRTKYPEIERIRKKMRKEQEKDDRLAHRKQQSGNVSTNKPIQKAPPKKDFFKSREWQELRWQVIKESDGRCVYCGRSRAHHGVTIHVDHIKPRSRFPHLALEKDNLQVVCEDCNMGKGIKDA